MTWDFQKTIGNPDFRRVVKERPVKKKKDHRLEWGCPEEVQWEKPNKLSRESLEIMYMNSVSKEKKTKKEQWEKRENAYFSVANNSTYHLPSVDWIFAFEKVNSERQEARIA